MKKEEIIPLIDTIIPRVYSFAFALLGDELQSEQIVADAFTVFIMRDKEFLLKEEFQVEDKKQRKMILKYLSKEMTRGVYELSIKRIPHLVGSYRKNQLEFESFYQLSINKRAVMYLKEVGLYSIKELQEIFSLKRHQIIETYHNARHELLNNNSSSDEEMMSWK